MTSIIVALSIALVLVTVCAVVVVAFFLRMCKEREAAAQQTMESLEARFSSLAAQELQGKSRAFLEQNRDSLAEITGNLRSELLRSMAELRLATESATRTNAEIGSVMRSQVDGVRQSAEALGRKAEGLERALSGGGKVQGIWGESVLAMVLKSSGLREDVDYFLQKGTHGAGIPDAEVIDPQGRVLVIDSKTSLTAFINACNTDDANRRKVCLAEHLKSVKRHIDELSSKDYISKLHKADPNRVYINQVAMFIPSEASYSAAVAEEASLINYAIDKGVAIVTPSTLLSYLRIVALAWQQNSIERSHESIISKAEVLVGRIDNCLVALESLGSSIKVASDNYEKVMGLLGARDGAHSIVKPAKDLISLGIKASKVKSKSLLNSDNIDED